VEISEQDPQIVGGNLGKLAKREDVSEAEMHRVIDNMLSLAASCKKAGSPQKALERLREQVERNKQPVPPTPPRVY
jgi:hypothetical protein